MLYPQDIREFFPQFVGYSDQQLNQLIADATIETPVETFGINTDRAMRYLVAHWLTIQQKHQTEVSGAMSAIDAGDVFKYPKKSYGLEDTYYGMEFLRIQRKSLTTIGVNIY